jgi:hypothetical protein
MTPIGYQPRDDRRMHPRQENAVTEEPQHDTDHAPRAWPEPRTPFLAQPRAHSALRHQLDAIAAEIKPALDRRRAARPDGTFELIVLPFRVVVRIDDGAVSFSWVSGRLPTVADGCLLVIAWANVAQGVRGVAALKSARPTHEQTYIAEGASPDEWRWTANDLVDEPRSTSRLTADWVDAIARDG